MSKSSLNIQQTPDREMVDIAHFILHKTIESDTAYNTAILCLMDNFTPRQPWKQHFNSIPKWLTDWNERLQGIKQCQNVQTSF